MTLSLDLFASRFSALCSRFGIQDESGAIGEAYYKFFSTRLSDCEFEEAVDQCLIGERFMPTALDILAKVRGSQKAQHLEAWEMILTAASRNQRPELPNYAVRALRNVGGLDTVGYADVNTQLPHIKRQFLEACDLFEQSEQARATRQNLLESNGGYFQLMSGGSPSGD